MTIDRETLIAYADGELDDIARARVEKAIAAEPALAAEVGKHRALRDRLAAHYEPFRGEAVPDRLTALLTPSNVVSIDDKRHERAARWSGPQWAAIAATLVLGLVVGQTIDLGGAGTIASRGGALIASGPLESALDTQLASAQPAGAPVRIGLSFRDEAGAYCRSFDQPALSGIACNEGGEWHLRRTIGGDRQDTQYRQASSPEIAAAAQAMMAGEPLDAAAERAALEAGWKQ